MSNLVGIDEAVKTVLKAEKLKASMNNVIFRISGKDIVVTRVAKPTERKGTAFDGDSKRERGALESEPVAIEVDVSSVSATPDGRVQVANAFATCLNIYQLQASWWVFRPSAVNRYVAAFEKASAELVAAHASKNDDQIIVATLQLKMVLSRAMKDKEFTDVVKRETSDDYQRRFLQAIIVGFHKYYQLYAVTQPEKGRELTLQAETASALSADLASVKETLTAEEQKVESAQRTVSELKKTNENIQLAYDAEKKATALEKQNTEEFKLKFERARQTVSNLEEQLKQAAATAAVEKAHAAAKAEKALAVVRAEKEQAEARGGESSRRVIEQASTLGELATKLASVSASAAAAEEKVASDKRTIQTLEERLHSQAAEANNHVKIIEAKLRATNEKVSVLEGALRAETAAKEAIRAARVVTGNATSEREKGELKDQLANSEKRVVELIKLTRAQEAKITEQKNAISTYAAVVKSLLTFASELYEKAMALLAGNSPAARGYVRDTLPAKWAAIHAQAEAKVSAMGLMSPVSSAGGSATGVAAAVSPHSTAPRC